MPTANFELRSVVALAEDLPAKGLLRGQVGMIVLILAPHVYEVEFSDGGGKAYVFAAIPAAKLMELHHEPKHHAA